MTFATSLRHLQCTLVTSFASGKKLSSCGNKTNMIWFTGMHGRITQLNLTHFPSEIEVYDTDKNEMYKYEVSEKTDKKVTYVSKQNPSLPIYLKVA